MTVFEIAVWLLLGGIVVFIMFAIRHARYSRTARCPHCCVQRKYYVGYARKRRTYEREPRPVRCKSCQIFFTLPE